MLQREDNPWYPNMRLFRPKGGEPQDGVIARVAQELAAVARGDMARLMPFKADGERRAAQAAAIMAAEAALATAPPVGATAGRQSRPGAASCRAKTPARISGRRRRAHAPRRRRRAG